MMTDKKAIATEDATAMAFLHMARQYHEAADDLFAANERRKETAGHRTINDPVYFSYFHTAELALKAYLRSHGLAIRGTDRFGHGLTELYEECRGLGLAIGPDDRFTIGNIVSLLKSGNAYQGFRYFTLNTSSVPSLEWTREVVGALMQVVAKEVEARENPQEIAAKGFKMVFTFPKPTPKPSGQPESLS